MDRVSRGAAQGERFAQLLHRPRRGGMVRDGHVHDAPALMGEDREDEEQATRRGRHHEEVRSHHLSDVICQERAPCLRRGLPAVPHVFRDRGLRDLDAKLEQLAVDPRRAPERVRLRHRPRDCTTPRRVHRRESTTEVIGEKRIRGWPQYQRRPHVRPFQ
jgi:hypothetical protein